MTIFKSFEEVSLSIVGILELTQPDFDSKPGSVGRDIFIDAPASEIARLYSELRSVSDLQSYTSASGGNLDRLAKNIGLVRGSGTFARGSGVFTTNDLSSDVFIPSGTLVSSSLGVSFRILTNVSMESSNSGVYRANALRLRSDLDLAGITDSFAIEVGLESTSPGTAGNIGRYTLRSNGLNGVSNVTNLQAFSGGQGVESEQSFRSRALGAFAGANVGTELGYRNAILADARVQDVLQVGPGDPLMVRDGTRSGVDETGNPIVISSGIGGKLDIYVQGTQSEGFSESMIYRDQSGKGDPTDPKNDITLGQRALNPRLDFQQRRRESMKTGLLPFQPVDSIVSMSGSRSGPNLVERYTDESGRVRGNFELTRDTGSFGGSPFGFDKVHFISDVVELENNPIAKLGFNSQDPLRYTDVRRIDSVTQDIVVLNEVATVSSSDRSLLTVKHAPVRTVTRVDNLTTGERYAVSSQNPDGGSANTTGRIRVSGSTLPVPTDVVHVSYIWSLEYDKNIDFDRLSTELSSRTVGDSIDWGFANRVIGEETEVLYSMLDGYHVIVEHPISKVVDVNIREEESIVNVGGKLVTAAVVTSIASIKNADGAELYKTNLNNGAFSAFEITLPTDTLSFNGETTTVVYNTSDIFSPDGYDLGSFEGAVIHVPDGTVSLGDTVFVDYVASIPTILPTTALADLPADGYNNYFIVDSNIVGDQPTSYHSTSGQFLRNSPTYLKMNIQGTTATGRLNTKGTSVELVEEIIVVRRDGLELDLTDAVRSHLGTSTVASTYLVGSVISIERVTLTNDVVSSVDFEFDLLNQEILNSTYANGLSIADPSLDPFQVRISATENNVDENLQTGQRLRVRFYLINTNASESTTIGASGVKYSKHRYFYVDRITVSSGFVGLSGNVDGTISIESFTQPAAGTTYLSNYSYTSPKEGERLVVNYNFNRLINDLTFRVERVRPTTADVLIKGATPGPVDVSTSIVINKNITQSVETIRQNVAEATSSYLSSQGLGSTIDASDLISVISNVDNVDRVVLDVFNLSGSTGVRKSLSVGRGTYITSGNIDVKIEDR